ncbi:MAG: NIPSNAP family protein [Thermoguttaceae bacterium]|nr:NIPSNAP family protein [Thermoguttaceae bacterium]
MKSLVWIVCMLALVSLVGATVLAADSSQTPAPQGKVFELRIYKTFPGKLDDLHKRFREHTCKLFQKHGIELVGFWVPAEGEEAQNTLIYLVAFPSKEAQAKAWKAFREDPEWIKAKDESHKNGVIVEKVESKNLKAVDYSPIK